MAWNGLRNIPRGKMIPQAHSEPNQTSKMEPFAKIKGFTGLFSGVIERKQLYQMGW